MPYAVFEESVVPKCRALHWISWVLGVFFGFFSGLLHQFATVCHWQQTYRHFRHDIFTHFSPRTQNLLNHTAPCHLLHFLTNSFWTTWLIPSKYDERERSQTLTSAGGQRRSLEPFLLAKVFGRAQACQVLFVLPAVHPSHWAHVALRSRARALLCSAHTPGKGQCCGITSWERLDDMSQGRSYSSCYRPRTPTQRERETETHALLVVLFKAELTFRLEDGGTGITTSCFIVSLLTDMNNSLPWKTWNVFRATLPCVLLLWMEFLILMSNA